MAKREIQAGATSRRERIFIADTSKTDGSGLTGLAFNSGGLTWKYIRDDQTTLTSVTPVTATIGVWTSGGFVEIGAGIYELGLPNAALASSTGVQMLLFGATNMAVTKFEIELTAVNNQDGVRGGMAALPSMASRASGGIAQGGTSTTITLASSASSLDNYYTGQTVCTTSGTGPNQTRIITGYVGSTRVATVDAAWVATPDNTTTYLLPGVEPAVLRSISITS